MENSARLRAVAYGRISTDTDDQLNSLENQKLFFTEYISKNPDWVYKGIYTDEGITGTNTKKRTAFNKMIADALNNEFDLIVTKEVSRFARNTVDTLSYTRKLKSVGVGVYFVNDNINTLDNDGEFRLSIMASVAQEESRKTSERVKWGMKRQMERGFVFVNKVLGYDCRNGILSINPEEADTVRSIFNSFVYGKLSLSQIAKNLNAENSNARYWYPVAIRRILSNEKYVGDLLQKKTYTPNYLEHKSEVNRGQEDKVFISDHHEPIIERELWNEAQAELLKRSGITDNPRRYTNRRWCSGMLICGICGSGYVVKTKSLRDGSEYIAWRCRKALMYGKNVCSNRQINDRVLIECVSFAMGNLDCSFNSTVGEIMKLLSETELQCSNQVKLMSALKQLKQKKARLLDLYLEGTIDKNAYMTKLNSYDEEIEKNESSLQYDISCKDDYEAINKRINEIMNAESGSTELYRNILDYIVIIPDNKLEIHFKDTSESVNVKYSSAGRGKNYHTVCERVFSEHKDLLWQLPH